MHELNNKFTTLLEVMDQIRESTIEHIKQEECFIQEAWIKEIKEAVQRGKNKTLEDVISTHEHTSVLNDK